MMTILILGLAIFLGVHLVPAIPIARRFLATSFGENRYKAIFSVASAVGLALIVAGYAVSGARERLFDPQPAAREIAPAAMTIAFILLAAANMRGYLRRILRHPMLIGLQIWSFVHLLANGDRAGTLLFGAIFAYAEVDLISAIARDAVKSFEPQVKYDYIAVIGGVLVALAVMTLHRILFGVAVVPFGI
jgi:uncharacterized membrane protein